MNLKDRLIIDEYRQNRASFVALGDVVHDMLRQIVERAGLMVLGIEHRVKAEDSLIGKLARNGDYYQCLDDLTDILGARVICFFSDEVDIIGKMVEESFVIDWENSSDKRALIKADTFGYLSLHYICSLPFNAGYPDDICRKRFEIQIRTNLQHTWAAINHDLGYKSEFGVPRVFAREFARIAGLLEIADDEFMRVSDGMHAYSKDIREKIVENRADDVLIDMISLREYVNRNQKMKEFLAEITSICGAELSEINPENYVEQLRWLGKKTLGDLQNMLKENHDLALSLAKQALSCTDLDILSSNVGLLYLCRAELYLKGYSSEQAAEFLKLSIRDKERAERQAERILQNCKKISEASHGEI